MEDYKNLRAIWEGELPLDRIKWNKISFIEFQISNRNKSEIKLNWDKHIIDYPNDYDGKLLFLDNIEFKDNYLYLDASFIRFSTIIFMVKNKIPVKKGIGMLGTQCLIFSSNYQYILIGKRSLSQIYYPGAMVNVGGMLEFEDLRRTPKEALMREVYEEIHLPLESNAHLKAILVGWNKISVTFLTSSTIDPSHAFKLDEEVIPVEKNEFEGNLRWLSIQDLKNLQSDQLFEGLFYYRSKLLRS
jgi:8-oxo-dGTP pyrophosphatase MutT (NUDIX family)